MAATMHFLNAVMLMSIFTITLVSCLSLEVINADDDDTSYEDLILEGENGQFLTDSKEHLFDECSTALSMEEQGTTQEQMKDIEIPSEPDSATPIDYIHLLASYMRPDVFHQFLKGLNKTLNASTHYSHPDFTYANSTIAKTQRKIKYPCLKRPMGNQTAQVKIVNSTELIEAINYWDMKDDNSSSILGGYCAFVMFYAPWCKFSASAAPAFNAIGRAFPDLQVLAIDAFQHNSLNTRYGIVAVPNILLFHNSKPVMRFNYSQRSFSKLTEFIRNFTGLEPNSSIQVSQVDTLGPLPNIPTEEPDYALWFSWFFLTTTALWCLKQRVGSVVMERVGMFILYARQVWRTGEFYDQVGVMVHDHHE